MLQTASENSLTWVRSWRQMPDSIQCTIIQCTIYLHYMYQIKTFFVPKQTAKTCHILDIVGDKILKKKKMKSQIVMIVLKYFYCIFCNLHGKCPIRCTKPSPLIDSLAGKHFWNSTPSSQSWKDVLGSNQTIFMFRFSNYISTCSKITLEAVRKY